MTIQKVKESVCLWYLLATFLNYGQGGWARGAGLSHRDRSVHGCRVFLPKVILPSQRSSALLSSVGQHVARGKERWVLFLLVNPRFLRVSGRLCVDPDVGWDDPRDGPWPRSAGRVGGWLCGVQWGPRARPGPEGQQISSGRWALLSRASWFTGEILGPFFLLLDTEFPNT